MLKDKCASTVAQHEERQKTCQLEMDACSKDLEVLSSDDAYDLFTFQTLLLCRLSARPTQTCAREHQLYSRQYPRNCKASGFLQLQA